MNILKLLSIPFLSFFSQAMLPFLMVNQAEQLYFMLFQTQIVQKHLPCISQKCVAMYLVGFA